ncbi:MAG: dihydrofolate reductase family protein [Verrucomicrobiae bacterium]|nr:dihydrofolate reductase family protein [Verrucomicrobiae bacterium]
MDFFFFSTSKIPPKITAALIYLFNLGSGFGTNHRRVKDKHSSLFASTNTILPAMRIVAVAAMSLNGLITRGSEPGAAFTSDADKAWFARAMQSFPIKVMGINTFEASQEMILRLVQKQPEQLRFVLTNRPTEFLKLNLPGRLEFMKATPEEVIEKIEERGRADEPIAIMGGSRVYSGFLQVGLLDELWITLEPQLFSSGTPLLQEACLEHLELRETEQLSPSTLLLKYKAGLKS